MRKIYSVITLSSGTRLVGNRPPTHYEFHPVDASRLIPVVSAEGSVSHVSIDAIVAIEAFITDTGE